MGHAGASTVAGIAVDPQLAVISQRQDVMKSHVYLIVAATRQVDDLNAGKFVVRDDAEIKVHTNTVDAQRVTTAAAICVCESSAIVRQIAKTW